MTPSIEPDQAVRLHRAETRWLRECADRLHQARRARRRRADRPAPGAVTR